MKKVLLFVFAEVIAVTFAFSQGTAINSSGNAADSSAILDVSSSTMGILVPRMTAAQKTAIASPASSLMVYQTDGVAGFYFNSGTPASPVWMLLGADNLGNHTAADSVNMTNNKIVNLATCTQNYDAANKLYVDNKVGAGGGGSAPTMVSGESVSAMNFGDAVRYCNGLSESTFTDWYLPAQQDLVSVISRGGVTVSDNSSANPVWTSTVYIVTELGAYTRYITYKFSDGAAGLSSGTMSLYTRCVR